MTKKQFYIFSILAIGIFLVFGWQNISQADSFNFSGKAGNCEESSSGSGCTSTFEANVSLTDGWSAFIWTSQQVGPECGSACTSASGYGWVLDLFTTSSIYGDLVTHAPDWSDTISYQIGRAGPSNRCRINNYTPSGGVSPSSYNISADWVINESWFSGNTNTSHTVPAGKGGTTEYVSLNQLTNENCNWGVNQTFCGLFISYCKALQTYTSGEPTADIKANDRDGPITIPYNTPATISWTSTDASSCNIVPTPPNGTGTSGSESSGNLTSSRTYELNCSGATDSVTVNVSAPPQPQIALTTNDITIPFGDVGLYGIANVGPPDSSMNWEFSTDSSWISAFANNGGSGMPGQKGTGAGIVGNPSSATIGTNYGSITEICTGGSGNCTGNATVSAAVTYNVPSPTVSLTADKDNINPGTLVNLTWSSDNTNVGNPVSSYSGAGFTPTTANGSQTVTPQTTTIYNIKVKGLSNGDASSNNSATSAVTVNVNPVCSPSTQTKKKNETATLTATGGNGAYFWSAPDGSPPSGNVSSFSTSYPSTGLKTITLTSEGKTTTCTVDVTQQNKATISLNPTVFYFTATQGGANPSPQTLTISNVGTVTSLKWTGSDNQSWLSFSPTSNTSPGVSAGGSQGVPVSINISGLALGTYSGTITISDPDASNSPQTAIVNLTINSLSSNPTLTVSKSGTGTGTVTSSPSGINCGSDCSESYTSGTSVTLTAAAASGSTFAGWSGGGCSGTGTCTLSLSSDTTVTATFNITSSNPILTVTKSGTGTGTVTSSPSGINCGSDCSESYTSGTSVTLTAAAASGSTFGGWSGGGCSGTGTCTITLNANTSVTASFSCGGGGSGSICGTADEARVMSLSCPAGETIISISFASYGTPNGSCGSFSASSCHAGTSLSVISSACLGKNSCSVTTNNETFGDPCEDVAKWLNVQVVCGGGVCAGANPPNASSVKATEANYCVGPGATVSWTYSDLDSDPQSAYQAQVDLEGSSFNPAQFDTGKVFSDSTSSVFNGIVFNTNYQARVKVWDSTDRASSFVSQTLCQGPGCSQDGKSWKTPKHAYPQVDFTWSPSSPAPSQMVQFTDLTTFFDGVGDGNHDWSWTFGDSGTSTLKNPSHTYLSAGSYNVSETVTDSDNFSCTTSPAKVITVKSQIPTWKEVSPKQ